MKSVVFFTLFSAWAWLLMMVTECRSSHYQPEAVYVSDAVVDTAKVVDSMNRQVAAEIGETEQNLRDLEKRLSTLRLEFQAVQKKRPVIKPAIDELQYVSPY